ncbi:peptidoglycan bridge formation glycyltransferase FemA/FemB family protein [Anaerococcus sp.]|uniref:lipid II:glycine glycyltransferase FemX n=1 Tax=Anaerococcus sp. TaxID=1872515 RepID=UPI0027B8DFFA|nr:peptidoglycan bridge formation glycyltransferase FemA/FemB family protein [Anaerococcus sp.]
MILDKNNKDLVKKYNDFIKNSPYGNFMQDMRWANIKANWESVYFYVEEDGEIKGALSVLYIRDGKVGKNFFYATRGPVCDLRDIELVKKLIDEASAFAKENDGFLLRIDPLVRRDEDLVKLYAENGITIRHDKTTSSQPLLNMVLDIDGRDGEEIFKNFSKNTRKHTRKSYRDGIETREVGEEGVDILYKQVVDTAERAGINHRPYEYFKALYDNYKDEIRLSVSYLDETPLCSSMLICYGNRALALYGGSSDEHKDMGQNYQINYEEVKYAAEKGYDHYDMGGIFEADDSDGLYKFKRKFTEENVENLIGEIDIVLDEKLYDEYIKEKNPHFKKEEEKED